MGQRRSSWTDWPSASSAYGASVACHHGASRLPPSVGAPAALSTEASSARAPRYARTGQWDRAKEVLMEKKMRTIGKAVHVRSAEQWDTLGIELDDAGTRKLAEVLAEGVAE